MENSSRSSSLSIDTKVILQPISDCFAMIDFLLLGCSCCTGRTKWLNMIPFEYLGIKKSNRPREP